MGKRYRYYEVGCEPNGSFQAFAKFKDALREYKYRIHINQGDAKGYVLNAIVCFDEQHDEIETAYALYEDGKRTY